MSTLVLRFANDLAFALPDPAPELATLLRRFFAPQAEDAAEAPPGALEITGEPAPVAASHGEALTARLGVTASRSGGVVVVAAPGVTGWAEPDTGRAGIRVESADPVALETFVSVGVSALLFELAAARGHVGLHAAAVAPRGRGVLLPGPSGAGKTTVFRGAHAAGFPVLSDDLVWLREVDGGFVVRALQRGVPSEPVPPPSLTEAPLAAVVCPTIVPRGPSRLVRIGCEATIAALLAEGSFLHPGSAGGRSFRALVRLAGSVPAYRLEAGPDRSEVPPLLAGLAG